MVRKLLIGLAALVMACSYTKKFSKADSNYCNSLVDCLRKGPPEEEKKGNYEVFSFTSEPITVVQGSKIIIYTGNLYGSGHCLSVKDGLNENMYCSLNNNNDLDAYSWSYKDRNQTRSMTVLKSDTPSGPNGKSWVDLEWEFREAQFIFGNKIKEQPNYFINPYFKEAIKRIRGF